MKKSVGQQMTEEGVLAKRALAGATGKESWLEAGYATPEDAARALLGDGDAGTGQYDVAVRLVVAQLRREGGA